MIERIAAILDKLSLVLSIIAVVVLVATSTFIVGYMLLGLFAYIFL